MYKTYFDIAAKNFTSNIDKIALVGDSNSTIPIEFVFVCNDCLSILHIFPKLWLQCNNIQHSNVKSKNHKLDAAKY